MITRAIALLIVVGDDRVLNTDDDWEKFLKYVEENEGWLGKRKTIHPRIMAP